MVDRIPPLPPGFTPIEPAPNATPSPPQGFVPVQEVSSTTQRPRAVNTSYSSSLPTWMTAVASMAVNPDDEIAIYARLSGIPRERFGRIGGNVVYADEAGNIHRAVAPVSEAPNMGEAAMRAGQYVASGVGPALPQVAGSIAALPFGGIPGQVLGASAGAAAVDALRQAGVNAFLNRNPLNIDLANVGGQAAMAGGSQLAGALVQRGLERNRLGVSGVSGTDRAAINDPQNLADWRNLSQQADDLGIPLRPDQITNMPSMQRNSRLLLRHPESVNPMVEFQRRQQGQAVPAALAREVDALAPPGAGAEQFTRGATETIGQARRARTSAARPYYNAAVNDAVPPGSLTGTFRAAATSFDTESPIAARVNYYANRIEAAQNAAQLDNIYKELRDEVQTLFRENPSSSMASNLSTVRDALNNIIVGGNGVPPLSPNIAQGRQVYSQMSPPVRELNRGLTGMADRLGNQAQDVIRLREGVTKILERGNEREIAAARQAYYAAGQGPAWDAGVNVYLRDAADAAGRIRMTGAVPGNVAGRFLTEIGSTGERMNAALAAVGGRQSPEGQRLLRLANVLQAASREVAEGAPTATDLAARSGLVGAPTRAALAPTRFTPGRFGNMLEEASIRRNAGTMAARYTSGDPMALIENAGVMSPLARATTQTAVAAVPPALWRVINGYLAPVPPDVYPVAPGGGR